jgi:hypothetical protein
MILSPEGIQLADAKGSKDSKNNCLLYSMKL